MTVNNGTPLPGRLEGWERRYQAVLDAARDTPYELGVHDCFRVACAVVEALTGVDRWPQWAGRYATKREALELLARHGGSFEAAFDWFFGVDHEPPRFARRGDIVALAEPDSFSRSEKHLGVCTGADAAFTLERGLAFVPVKACICCWRIG